LADIFSVISLVNYCYLDSKIRCSFFLWKKR